MEEALLFLIALLVTAVISSCNAKQKVIEECITTGETTTVFSAVELSCEVKKASHK
jgi:hypothetical protein